MTLDTEHRTRSAAGDSLYRGVPAAPFKTYYALTLLVWVGILVFCLMFWLGVVTLGIAWAVKLTGGSL